MRSARTGGYREVALRDCRRDGDLERVDGHDVQGRGITVVLATFDAMQGCAMNSAEEENWLMLGDTREHLRAKQHWPRVRLHRVRGSVL
jgi:hypothetical protein